MTRSAAAFDLSLREETRTVGCASRRSTLKLISTIKRLLQYNQRADPGGSRKESSMTFALIALVALLAFANGSNDNSKGVATLVGFGAARPFPALIYATLATAAGGTFSFFIAGGLLKGFSGGFLFARGIVLDQRFYVAVLIGACGWVLLATKTGMPVSTTHAIVGA